MGEGRFNLAKLGLKPGEVLHFEADAAITCKVADENNVIFQGERRSLTSAARETLKQFFPERFSYHLNGPWYWKYYRVRLSEMKKH